MQVILLEKVGKLGDLGDVVKVKQGFARNYLIPTKLARRATEAAIKEFEGRRAELEKAAWPRPKLFDWMQAEGNVAENEMHRVFNCGIGLVVVVAAADADAAMAELKAQGEAVYRIGKIRARSGDEAQTLVV